MKIPFVDLKAQLQPIRSEILQGINTALDKCNFILGEEVQQFEKDFARYCNAQHCIGVASGLEALHLTVRALGIGPGDEVLVPANTFIATALGVSHAGATPIPVDVDARTMLMDPKLIEKSITKKTKAIMPVHLYGRMTDMKPILDISKRHGLRVIEDAAQAHGARLGSHTAGSAGVAGCFSFYPGKNLGCYGDGGAVVTNDSELAAKITALRNYGSAQKYHHPIIGYNSRLDTMQAVVLQAKLPHLDSYNKRRYEAAVKYNEALKGVGDLVLPEISERGSHVFHIYLVRTKKREALMKYLGEQGVATVIHYPTPLHLHGAYENLGFRKGAFPVSEQLCQEIVSLPMFPELKDEQIHYTAKTIKDFFSK